ncbi:MAG: hypothetical protein RTU30_14715 [Candidatus Thorarchaeota archaeon]
MSLTACSKPTKSLPPNEIVEALLDLPPYPNPPLTEENTSNESYQAAVNHCNGADYWLLWYKSMIQRFLVNEIEAVNSNGDWQWILSEYGSTHTLTVVPKDTLTFVLDVELYGGRHIKTVGWIIPDGYAAEIITEGEHVRWNRDANGLWFTAGSMTNPVRSFISPSGQGWLSWSATIENNYIRIVWDGQGHGYYESSYGSGSW